MARKKKKTQTISVVAVFLIVVSLAATGAFAYLYFKDSSDLVKSTRKLSEIDSKNDQLTSDVSALQSQLASVEEEKRQIEIIKNENKSKSYSLISSHCDIANCLLSSSRDSLFGLSTVKGHYRKLEKKNEDGTFFCPAIVITEADANMLNGLEKETASWVTKDEGSGDYILEIDYGSLSTADKNAIKSSTANSPIEVSLFANEMQDGIGLEGLDCFSAWTALSVK